ncbi:MAG TPA: hypothetical protein VLV90_01235 [Burkholderiales bacterium]|nr:hypothetical protein [Burkholderiales bacterium]
MQIIELIRTASTNSEVLTALSVYAGNLRDIVSLPDWFQQPLQGEADVRERMLALMAVVNFTSQHLRYAECNAAKRALRVFAEALSRLNPRARPGA